ASRKAQSCAGCLPWAQHLRQGNIIIITSRYAPSSYNRCEHESQKLHFSNHEGSMMTHTHTHTHTHTQKLHFSNHAESRMTHTHTHRNSIFPTTKRAGSPTHTHTLNFTFRNTQSARTH